MKSSESDEESSEQELKSSGSGLSIIRRGASTIWPRLKINIIINSDRTVDDKIKNFLN